MPNARLIDANSIIEWRLSPERLDNELAAFLSAPPSSSPTSAARRQCQTHAFS